MNITRLIAYFKLAGVVLIWAGVFHVGKYLVGDTDIFTISFLRFLIATIILLSIYFAKHGIKKAFIKPDEHWKILWLIGLIGVFGYNVLFFGAETLVSANKVAIFFAFTPCITIVLGKAILGHKVKPLAYGGIIVALLGTIGVITMSKDPEPYSCIITNTSLPLGEILSILAAVAMALYNVLNKKAAEIGLDSLTITTFSALMGTLFLFVTFLLFGHHGMDIMHKSVAFWVSIIYTSVIATVVAYRWYSDAIRELGVGKTSVFQNGIPLFTVLIGVVFLGNHVSTHVLLSGLVIIIGVIMTNMSSIKNK